MQRRPDRHNLPRQSPDRRRFSLLRVTAREDRILTEKLALPATGRIILVISQRPRSGVTPRIRGAPGPANSAPSAESWAWLTDQPRAVGCAVPEAYLHTHTHTYKHSCGRLTRGHRHTSFHIQTFVGHRTLAHLTSYSHLYPWAVASLRSRNVSECLSE